MLGTWNEFQPPPSPVFVSNAAPDFFRILGLASIETHMLSAFERAWADKTTVTMMIVMCALPTRAYARTHVGDLFRAAARKLLREERVTPAAGASGTTRAGAHGPGPGGSA